MDWSTSNTDARVQEAFNAYRHFVLDVATQYGGAKLLERLDLSSLGDDEELPLSQNFPMGFTTVRTIGELRNAIEQGVYGQICIRMATIQLCTAFEILFDALAALYSLKINNQTDQVQATYKKISSLPITLGSRAIMQIRKLHTKLGVDTVANEDEVLVKLTAIIELRNCIVHSAAVVSDSKKSLRLRAYGFNHQVGDTLSFGDDILDDFLHFMASHARVLVDNLPSPD